MKVSTIMNNTHNQPPSDDNSNISLEGEEEGKDRT